MLLPTLLKRGGVSSGISSSGLAESDNLLYCMKTVRVIDSPVLWDNRQALRLKKKRSKFYFVPHSIMLGLIVCVGLLVFYYQSNPNKVAATTKQLVQIAPTFLPETGHVAGKSVGLDPLMPESD